ncbi:MAG: hypothetical protein ACI36W_06945 [Coriobacteriales bacterium]
MSVELIEHNPALKKPAMAVLHACENGQAVSRQQLIDLCSASWCKAWRQSPASTIDILTRSNALDETITVEGEPYNGTLEQLQLDMSVPEDAAWESSISPTALGEQILADYAPNATITALYESKPQYADVFDAAIQVCAAPEGCTRTELEAAINAFPQLKPDPQTQQTKVFAQYFIDALETAGAITWDGAWKASSEGRRALAS